MTNKLFLKDSIKPLTTIVIDAQDVTQIENWLTVFNITPSTRLAASLTDMQKLKGSGTITLDEQEEFKWSLAYFMRDCAHPEFDGQILKHIKKDASELIKLKELEEVN